MNSHNFSPLMSSPRRGCRADDLLDDFPLQNLLSINPFSFADLSINDMARSPRRGYPSTHDFQWPAWCARSYPVDAFAGRSSDGPSLRMNSFGPGPNPRTSFGTRYPFHTVRPEPSSRSRFIDIVDEDQSARNGGRDSNWYNEESLPPFGPRDWDYEREQRSENRRPRFDSSSRHVHDEPRERHFRPVNPCQFIPRPSGYRHSNVRSTPQKEGALPFGKAMRWLHEGLVDVEKTFQKFQSDYNKEVKAIDTYAGAEILQTLWVRKVSGKESAQNNSQSKKTNERWEEKFADKRASLREAMDAALHASLSLGDQETPKPTTLESRKRLQEKVETAAQQVMDLLDLVAKKSEHCKALLDELKLLKDLVDPRKNKDLYDGVDGGASGGGQDNGNDDNDDDGGQGGWQQDN